MCCRGLGLLGRGNQDSPGGKTLTPKAALAVGLCAGHSVTLSHSRPSLAQGCHNAPLCGAHPHPCTPHPHTVCKVCSCPPPHPFHLPSSLEPQAWFPVPFPLGKSRNTQQCIPQHGLLRAPAGQPLPTTSPGLVLRLPCLSWPNRGSPWGRWGQKSPQEDEAEPGSSLSTQPAGRPESCPPLSRSQ